MTFYDGDAFPTWRGKLLVAGLSAGRLLLADVRNTQVLSVTPLLIDTPRRLRDVAVAPDGTVYLVVDGEQGSIVRLSPQRGADATR